MNKRAEEFNKFLIKKEIKCFTVEEIKDDKFETVIFRSNININGQQLPTIVILDNSIYGMIRVLVAPKVLNKNNEIEMRIAVNELNKTYKSFKYYFDNEDNLVLDCCVLLGDIEHEGNLIYTMLDVIIKHLNGEYKNLMQLIWK